jgi:hypothetical protein
LSRDLLKLTCQSSLLLGGGIGERVVDQFVSMRS